jgi:dihydrofolate reductase
MSTVTVITNLTLDGVMQAPARPDEDQRDGFTHGGWAIPYSGDAMGRLLNQGGDSRGGAMLFGRRTYEDFAKVWPAQQDNPYTDALNRNRKYVVSTTLKEPLPWQNSVVVPDLSALKTDEDLIVLGSGALVRSLLKANLVDEFKLLIHPLVLGSGRRLFGDRGDRPVPLRLAGDAETTSTGVVIATYRPERA